MMMQVWEGVSPSEGASWNTRHLHRKAASFRTMKGGAGRCLSLSCGIPLFRSGWELIDFQTASEGSVLLSDFVADALAVTLRSCELL